MTTDGNGVVQGVRRRRAPTERTWWQAGRDTWTHPRQWRVAEFVTLAVLVVVLTVLALWVSQPGQWLGGAEPISASLRYSDDASHTYIYELSEPWGNSTARQTATLQHLYDAHKAAAAGFPMELVILQRDASSAPFITGSGDLNAPGVIGRAIYDGKQHQAAIRRDGKSGFQPVELHW